MTYAPRFTLTPAMLAEVASILMVSDRTARTWLQDWHDSGLIQPQRPDVQRTHAWVLSPSVADVVAREMAP